MRDQLKSAFILCLKLPRLKTIQTNHIKLCQLHSFSSIRVKHTYHTPASSWCTELECKPGRSEPAAPDQALGDLAGSLPHKLVGLAGRGEAGEPQGGSW